MESAPNATFCGATNVTAQVSIVDQSHSTWTAPYDFSGYITITNRLQMSNGFVSQRQVSLQAFEAPLWIMSIPSMFRGDNGSFHVVLEWLVKVPGPRSPTNRVPGNLLRQGEGNLLDTCQYMRRAGPDSGYSQYCHCPCTITYAASRPLVTA